jgi:U32 family peptidase
MKKTIDLPHILAPAGNFACLTSAIKAGANCIYFGIDKLNMRSKSASNFNLSDIEKIVDICSRNNVQSYITLNSVIYNSEIAEMKEICKEAKEKGICAIIAHDMAVINYARSIDMPIHISTQANVSNIEAVIYYSKFADCIVLARELDIDQIKSICDEIKNKKIKGPSGNLLKIEIFIHGALCAAISGKCYMSLFQYNHSANKGKCLQACRRKYLVTEMETKKELIIDNNYIMSPKDLCTIDYLEQITSSGVNVLKIEGRARTADYVYVTTKTYVNAIKETLGKDPLSTKQKEKYKEDLKSVYNRGFWNGGYYLNKDLNAWSNTYGSCATTEKTFIGNVTNYFQKSKIAEIKIKSHNLQPNDNILFIGETTGAVYHTIENMVNHTNANSQIAKKEDLITMQIKTKLRRNDKLYLLKTRTCQ